MKERDIRCEHAVEGSAQAARDHEANRYKPVLLIELKTGMIKLKQETYLWTRGSP